MRYLMLLLIPAAILSGCENSDIEAKLLQRESEISSLKKELVSLNDQIAKLEKSEQNLFNTCMGASIVSSDSHEANREKIVHAKSGCEELIEKYPKGQYNATASEELILMDELASYFSAVIKIEDYVNNNEFDKAEAELNLIQPNLKQEERERLHTFIAKNRDKPVIFASMRDFHKAAATGMKVGKKYSVYAALMPDGERLCGELKDASSYKYCATSETSVSIGNEFYGDQARDFYEMRGQYGCFTVTMYYGGTLNIVAYSRGGC